MDVRTATDAELLVDRCDQAIIPVDPLLGQPFVVRGIDWPVHISLLRYSWER